MGSCIYGFGIKINFLGGSGGNFWKSRGDYCFALLRSVIVVPLLLLAVTITDIFRYYCAYF
jgi:hypothetical protein